MTVRGIYFQKSLGFNCLQTFLIKRHLSFVWKLLSPVYKFLLVIVRLLNACWELQSRELTISKSQNVIQANWIVSWLLSASIGWANFWLNQWMHSNQSIYLQLWKISYEKISYCSCIFQHRNYLLYDFMTMMLSKSAANNIKEYYIFMNFMENKQQHGFTYLLIQRRYNTVYHYTGCPETLISRNAKST